MNADTFNAREFFLYLVPVMIVDLLIYILINRWTASAFTYLDPADLIMAENSTVYCLVVSYFMAVAIVPIRFYKRGVDSEKVLVYAFWQTFITLSLFALSIFVLFGSFAGKFFLQEGIACTVAISLWHLLFRTAALIINKKVRNKMPVVIVGIGPNALRLYDTINNWNCYNDYQVLGFFDDNSVDIPDNVERLGGFDDLDSFLNENKVCAVYCSINPATNAERVNKIIRTCENLFIEFYYVPNMDGYLHRTMTYTEIGHVLVFKLRDEPLSNWFNSFLKRLFDITFSALFLVTLFPLIWAFVAVGTRISSPGPIIFRQRRTGYKGKSFTLLKFRSMKVNADADRLQATADDPRKTGFGDFLRKTSIDELPQFINVLKGDMSIIGPRPHMELHTEMYNKLVDEYMVRHMVRPGLTGWAQVNGCRGETKEVWQMADRVKYDIWYIEHWSFLLDVKIFLITVLHIFRRDKQAY